MHQTAVSDVYSPIRPPPIARLREIRSFFRRGLSEPEPAPRPVAQHNSAKGSHGAVLVIPALMRGDRQTQGLRAELARHGYAAFGWGLGADFGPTPALMAGAEARLLALAREHGPVNLVGLSMGGLFCRWLAFRHPHCVRQVITVCSPFRAALDSFWLPLRPLLKVWPAPGIAALAGELEHPLPVPGTYLYSKHDGIVAWQSCIDVRSPQDCYAIEGSHVTIAVDPSVRAILLARLGRSLDAHATDAAATTFTGSRTPG